MLSWKLVLCDTTALVYLGKLYFIFLLRNMLILEIILYACPYRVWTFYPLQMLVWQKIYRKTLLLYGYIYKSKRRQRLFYVNVCYASENMLSLYSFVMYCYAGSLSSPELCSYEHDVHHYGASIPRSNFSRESTFNSICGEFVVLEVIITASTRNGNGLAQGG